MEDDAMARPEVTGRKVRVTGKRARKALQAQAPPNTPPDDDDEPAHNSKTARRRLYQNLPVAMYTIATFCVAHDISESFYHKLKNKGRGPRETHLGARVLITMEAAADWRAAREAETPASNNTNTNTNTITTAGAI